MSIPSAEFPKALTACPSKAGSGSESIRSTKANILHTRVVTGTGGGPEKTILNSPRFLKPKGYKALCAFMHPVEDPGFEELRRRGASAGAEVISIPDRGPFDLSLVKKLVRLCQRENVTIWHAHDYKSNVMGLLVNKKWPMHLVTTVHGWDQRTWRSLVYYRIDRWAQKRYDKVICVSSDLLDTVRKAGVASEKSLLIDNAIDTELNRRRSTAHAMKERLGFRSDRKLIGAVGRLSREKNFACLIEAVSHLLEQGHDVELAIGGEGGERENLERFISLQPDPTRFHLLGFQSELSEFYQALDVFALSSLWEGLPNVLLEAMAFQVPVVSTEAGGVARLVQNEQNGLLVPVDDVARLTQALEKVLRDQGLAETLAARGRQTIEERFSFQARMDRVCAVYEELLSR